MNDKEYEEYSGNFAAFDSTSNPQADSLWPQICIGLVLLLLGLLWMLVLWSVL